MTWTNVFPLVIRAKTFSIVLYSIPLNFQLYQGGTGLKYDGDTVSFHIHRVRRCSQILNSSEHQVSSLGENDPCKS